MGQFKTFDMTPPPPFNVTCFQFRNTLKRLKTVFLDQKSLFLDAHLKWLMIMSIAECYRVLQSVTDCYRVLQSVTECYSVRECYRMLQSISSASTWTNFWACFCLYLTHWDFSFTWPCRKKGSSVHPWPRCLNFPAPSWSNTFLLSEGGDGALRH